MYKLLNVPAGGFVIWATAEIYAPYVKRLSLNNSQRTKIIDIRLADPCALYGTIVDSDGKPVADANIYTYEYKGVTNLTYKVVKSDSNGKFVIPNAPPKGEMVLGVWGKFIKKKFVQI